MKTIQNKEIESRRLVTDQAIIESILPVPAKTVLDIGYGEGWLVRELPALGLSTSGIDAIQELVNSAK